jgi:hypothetical protein
MFLHYKLVDNSVYETTLYTELPTNLERRHFLFNELFILFYIFCA